MMGLLNNKLKEINGEEEKPASEILQPEKPHHVVEAEKKAAAEAESERLRMMAFGGAPSGSELNN